MFLWFSYGYGQLPPMMFKPCFFGGKTPFLPVKTDATTLHGEGGGPFHSELQGGLEKIWTIYSWYVGMAIIDIFYFSMVDIADMIDLWWHTMAKLVCNYFLQLIYIIKKTFEPCSY
jgi:hypothetical protein